MRDNPDDLANQKIKRAITKLKKVVYCLNRYCDISGPPGTILDYVEDTIKDLKKQD